MSTPHEVDRVFSPIARAIERFASEHALRLDKCTRGNTGWELTRSDDRGGDVFLLLLYDERLGLGIGSVWQFPCPQMSLQYSHFRPVRKCPLEPDAVSAALATELRELAHVPFGYWTHLRPLQHSPSQDSAEPGAQP